MSLCPFYAWMRLTGEQPLMEPVESPLKSVTFYLIFLLHLLAPEAFSDTPPYADYQNTVAPDAWSTPFNMISQVACHNCYDPRHSFDASGKPILMQEVLSFITAVEIDIWDTYTPLPFSSGKPRHWYVRHGEPSDRTGIIGNYSNCTPPGSLEECLADINTWSEQHPGHFPVTVFLDKKQNWSKKAEGRQVEDLSWLLRKKLGNKLYTPHDQSTYSSHNNVTHQAMWPEAKDMAGKIIVVITGNNFLLSALCRYFQLDKPICNNNLEQPSLFTESSAVFTGPYATNLHAFVHFARKVSKTAEFLNADYNTINRALPMPEGNPDHNLMIRLWNVDNQSFCHLSKSGVAYAAYYNFSRQGCHGVRIRPVSQ